MTGSRAKDYTQNEVAFDVQFQNKSTESSSSSSLNFGQYQYLLQYVNGASQADHQDLIICKITTSEHIHIRLSYPLEDNSA